MDMSEPSIVIEHLTNTWKSNRSVPLKRLSRRDKSKSENRKRRKYSSCSFSSSSLSSLSSLRRSRKSKKSKRFQKKRRPWSSSFSSEYIKDYGQYQWSWHTSPQAVNVHSTLQPDRVVEEPLNIQSIIWCIIHQRIQNWTPKWIPDPLIHAGLEPSISVWGCFCKMCMHLENIGFLPVLWGS